MKRFLLLLLSRTLLLLSALLPLVPALVVESPFEFDSDEGLYASHASLLHYGHELYTQIWTDQPPFVPVLLSWSYAAFGVSFLAARLPVALLSLLLLLALFSSVSRGSRILAGTFAVVFLVVSPGFLRLSTAVMVGGPAVSLAMIACWMLLRAFRDKKRQALWLALSGICFACSLLSKFFTVVAVPGVFAFLLFATREQGGYRWRTFLSLSFLWGSALILASVLYTGIFAPGLWRGELYQLIAPHGRAEEAVKFSETFVAIEKRLRADLPRLALGMFAVGLWILRPRRFRPEYILPISWSVAAYVAVLFHRPLWWHHYLLLAVPLAWLAGLGLQEGLVLLRAIRREISGKGMNLVILPAMTFLVIGWSIATIPAAAFEQLRGAVRAAEDGRLNTHVLTAMNSVPNTKWIVTDKPAYAVVLDRAIPPELSLFCDKRRRAGYLTDDKIVSTIRSYAPEQVMLLRFGDLHEQVIDYLQNDYRAVWKRDGRALYVRSSHQSVFEEQVRFGKTLFSLIQSSESGK